MAAASSLTLQQTLRPPPIQQGSHGLTYHSLSPSWQCAFSRDARWLAACCGAQVHMWKQESTSNKWTYHSALQDDVHSRTIRSIAWAPTTATKAIIGGCNYVLAAASFDGTVSIWECEEQDEWTCTTQLEGHDSEVKSVTWNHTGSLLATCGRDKTVWIWETWLEGTIGDRGGSSSTNDWDCLAILSGHEGDVKCIQFAPSHGTFGSGDEILISAGYDDTIRIWAEDGEDWYCAMVINDVHVDTIWSLSVAPGGGRMVSASADGSIGIFKYYSPTEQQEQEGDDDVEDEPGQRSKSKKSGLWKCVGRLPGAHSMTVPGAFDSEDPTTAAAVAAAILPPCTIYGIHCAPARTGHGRIASCGSDGAVHVYREIVTSSSDAPQFTVDATAENAGGCDVHSVCWHPYNGSILASAGDDGAVRIWKYRT